MGASNAKFRNVIAIVMGKVLKYSNLIQIIPLELNMMDFRAVYDLMKIKIRKSIRPLR